MKTSRSAESQDLVDSAQPGHFVREPTSWLSKRKLAKYFMFSVLGPGLPMILALVTVPLLIQKLGVERYALLNLAWLILGYFTLFDLGLGRAAVRLFAEKLGQKDVIALRSVYFTTLILSILVGVSLGIGFGIFSDIFVSRFFKIEVALRDEAQKEIFCLAFAMPFIALTAIFKGFLEVEQKFLLSNILQAVTGVLTYLGPISLVYFRNSLVWIVGLMVLIRILVFFVYFAISFRALPQRAGASVRSTFDLQVLKRLLKMGSWVTLSNLVGPVMTYADRMLIGSLISLGAVAYYSTSYDLVTRIWVITGALNQVLFPAFSSLVFSNAQKARELYEFGLKIVLNLVFPLLLIVSCFAFEGLKLWLGAEFASQSYLLLQIFCVGIFLNVLAQVSFVYLQSRDRADLPAKFQLFEVGFFIGGVFLGAKYFGLIGVAFVWSLRMLIDLALLKGAVMALEPSLRASMKDFLKAASPLFLGLVLFW